ncbi:MAG: BMP family ABC transporter substrate-binding protein [Acidimicrobiales bacterium]
MSLLFGGLQPSGASSPAAARTNSAKPAKVALKTGWIYDGSVADRGYDEEWYNAQLYLQKTVGIKAQYVQNTPYTSQWTSTALSMMASGDKIVFDPGEGGSLFYAACKKYPGVACVEANGTKPFPSNSTAVYSKNWEDSYLEGMAAGLMTKTGIIGFLEAFANTPAPVMETLNALVLGCQATHPGCRAIADVVNSWYNPPVETEDLNALVDAHADILASTQNDPSVVEVAAKRGVRAIATWADPVSSGPKAFITATDVNYGPALAAITKRVAAGTYKGGSVDLFGFGHGLTLAPWGPSVPKSVKARVDAAEAKMRAGKNFFCGPIYSNTGALKIKRGQCMGTLQLYDKWNWYVKGVSISK